MFTGPKSAQYIDFGKGECQPRTDLFTSFNKLFINSIFLKVKVYARIKFNAKEKIFVSRVFILTHQGFYTSKTSLYFVRINIRVGSNLFQSLFLKF